ncbi:MULTISPECIES: type II toxin-antitoxin system RelE/ParE family toxin [Calothrix]|uniref:Type II toxin-antitoxin system RelE/ParE family toxin n=2 Tax=Calothrix TaxID=1186 RepID=A0ABR8A4C4_9CYAN|nr:MULTISPECIES: type II toxin-antitoxin system RelE/ParE family toxin [Calothrix]MBD2194811.1 type II toxin-antitoxin system RelE/ParE family toxin [Calothrix parietina FACHB-288]MBD2228811.1 type II toxin-antitoxin system RelE/ParE family toxin [Calothrix anomala FACHB-343]
MPETRVIFYQDRDGVAPVLEWLKMLLKQDRKGYANCVARIQQLASTGYELRRPAADYLRDGIYELRAKHVRVQYRILYFFSGQNVAILAHAIAKDENQVPDMEPDMEIERAIQRKTEFEVNPAIHTYTEEIENGSDK